MLERLLVGKVPPYKAGIKTHTLYEIQTDISTFIHITETKAHDQCAMNEIPYEQGAYYVFDRGYFDLKRLYHINEIEAYFVIRQRENLQYQVISESDTMHNADGILPDQVIRLTNLYQTGISCCSSSGHILCD